MFNWKRNSLLKFCLINFYLLTLEYTALIIFCIRLRSFESRKIWVAGLIVDEVCDQPNHWKHQKSLHDWLYCNKVPGIFGIDTRELTKHIRNHGTMLGKIIMKNISDQKMLLLESRFFNPNELNLVSEVSVKVKILRN